MGRVSLSVMPGSVRSDVPRGPGVYDPDCGLKTRGWPKTESALRNMVAAALELSSSQAASSAA